MNKIKLATIAILAFTFAVSAQVYSTIPLPFTTITGGNTNLGGLTNNTSTNISGGWTTTSYTTNVTRTWSNVLSGFVNFTNIVTNTVTSYADFNAIGNPYVCIQTEFASSGSSVSNVVLTVARSLTGSSFDTLNNFTITNTTSGATPSVGIFQIDMRGYPYGRIITFAWNSTNAAQFVTNRGIYYTTKQIGQGGGAPSGR